MPTQNKNPIIKLQRQFILAALILFLVALVIFANTFLSTLLVSAVIVTAVYPLHKLLHKKIKVPNAIAAFISLVLVAIVILIPLTILFFIIAEEATSAYLVISEKFTTYNANGGLSLPGLFQIEWVENLMNKVNEFIPITPTDIANAASEFIGKISSVLLGQTTSILKNLTVFLIHIVVFLLSMFYFLKDGKKFLGYISSLLPLSGAHQAELLQKLNQLSYGIIYGIFGAAVIQGILMGIGFAIVGIENAVFWGAIAGLFSPLPYIGTATISVPVLIGLLFAKKWLLALFLLIWSLTIVGGADNIVKPYIIGSSSALHPLAVLVVLLGGAFTFGLEGFLFGPFVLTLTLAFLHIYKLEYQSEIRAGEKTKVIKKKFTT